MVILARRYWPKECERCNWWCGTNDNATQAGPSTRGDGHRRSGAARDEEATEIQFKPKSRCDVRPGILPGKMSLYEPVQPRFRPTVFPFRGAVATEKSCSLEVPSSVNHS